MTHTTQVLSDEQIEGLIQTMSNEFEDQPDFWPIAKLVVKDDKIESASFFAPGLPDGEHEVYPAPTHLDEHTAAWFAVHGALERHVPEMLKFGGTGIQCAVNAIEYLASKALTPMQSPISEADIERLFRTVKAWPLAENCTRDEWFWFANGVEQGARAIESATLKAVSGQEPVATVVRTNLQTNTATVSYIPNPLGWAPFSTGTKLFALPPAKPALVDEREAFDAWYDAFEFRREYDKYGPTEAAWSAWQARAAL